jgi:hypothetical protein
LVADMATLLNLPAFTGFLGRSTKYGLAPLP